MVQSYKPGLAHFEAMLGRLAAQGIGRDAVLHVAQSRFHDIEPARRMGVTSVLVDRRAGRPGRGITMPSKAVPDYRVVSMMEAADLVAKLRAGTAG